VLDVCEILVPIVDEIILSKDIWGLGD